ncbi:MAG: Helix-turn-helix domain [Verrucomicrobiota bacterium]|jgi:biotin operon repressor
METLAIAKKHDPARPLPDHGLMLTALGHTARWRMLRALSAGEAMSVTELSEVAGCSVDMSSKHLKSLKAAGLVLQKRNRCYAIPPAHQPVPGEPLLDYGHCVLRLDAAG